MKLEIRIIFMLGLSAILTACNFGAHQADIVPVIAPKNINLGHAINFAAAQRNDNGLYADLTIDLSSSTMLATQSKYECIVFNPYAAESSSKWYPSTELLNCNNRNDCILTLRPGSKLMESLNTSAANFNGIYNFYILLLNPDNHTFVGAANPRLDSFSDGNLIYASVDFYAVSNLFQELLRQKSDMSNADFLAWEKTLFNDAKVQAFKNSIDPPLKNYVSNQTLIYFYYQYELNRSPLTPTNFPETIDNLTKKILTLASLDSGFTANPQLSAKILDEIIQTMHKNAQDKAFAEIANSLISGINNYITPTVNILAQYGPAKNLFVPIYGLPDQIARFLDFISEQSGSAAALAAYNTTQAGIISATIPDRTTLAGLDQMRKNIQNMNSKIIAAEYQAQVSSINYSVNVINDKLNYESIGLFMLKNFAGTLLSTQDLNLLPELSWMAATKNGVTGEFVKNRLENRKSVIDQLNNPANITSITEQMKDAMGLYDSAKEYSNIISRARYYNYQLQQLMLERISLNNKFAYIEKSAAFAKLGNYNNSSLNSILSSVIVNIPDVSNASDYNTAVRQIDLANKTRNQGLYNNFKKSFADIAQYIPLSARHLLEDNLCDFIYSDQAAHLGAYCKYFVPTTIKPSGYLLVETALDARGCNKASGAGNLMDVISIDNILGNLTCFNSNNALQVNKIPHEYTALTWSENDNTKDPEYLKNDNFFYAGMNSNPKISLTGSPNIYGRIAILSEPKGSQLQLLSNNTQKPTFVFTQLADLKPFSEYWDSRTSCSSMGCAVIDYYTRGVQFPIGIIDKLGNKLGNFNVAAFTTTQLNGDINYLTIVPQNKGCYLSGAAQLMCKAPDNQSYQLDFVGIAHKDAEDKNGYKLDILGGYRALPYTELKASKHIYNVVSSICDNTPGSIAGNGYFIAARSCTDIKGYTKSSVFGNGIDKLFACLNPNGIINCQFEAPS